MRVSTSYSYLNALFNLNKGRQAIETLQEQATTLKLINRPADNPTGAAAVLRLNSMRSSISQYQSNNSQSTTLLSSYDQTILQVQDVINDAIQLAQKGGDDALDSNARAALAADAEGLIADLITIGNSKVGSRYLYGGSTGDVSPFTATGLYQGNPVVSTIGVSDNASINQNLAASEFMTVDMDPKLTNNTLLKNLNNGSGLTGTTGTFTITDRSGNTSAYDVNDMLALYAVADIGDATMANWVDFLENQGTGTANISVSNQDNRYLKISSYGTGNLTISDVTGSTMQSLGLATSNSGVDGDLMSPDLDPALTADTLVADLRHALNGGAITLGNIDVEVGEIIADFDSELLFDYTGSAAGTIPATLLPATMVPETINQDRVSAFAPDNDFRLNGVVIAASVPDGVSFLQGTGSAIARAAAINAETANTGVVATVKATELEAAYTFAPGADLTLVAGAPAANEGNLLINGVAITGAVAGVDDAARLDALIALIDAQTGATGVDADKTYDGKLVLTAADGRNIVLETLDDGTDPNVGLAESFGLVKKDNADQVAVNFDGSFSAAVGGIKLEAITEITLEDGNVDGNVAKLFGLTTLGGEEDEADQFSYEATNRTLTIDLTAAVNVGDILTILNADPTNTIAGAENFRFLSASIGGAAGAYEKFITVEQGPDVNRDAIAVTVQRGAAANGLGLVEADNTVHLLQHLEDALANDNTAEIRALLDQLDGALERAISAYADVGARGRRLENTDDFLANTDIELERQISEWEDADYLEVMTNLLMRQTTFEATLNSVAQILPVSLMDFLG